MRRTIHHVYIYIQAVYIKLTKNTKTAEDWNGIPIAPREDLKLLIYHVCMLVTFSLEYLYILVALN